MRDGEDSMLRSSRLPSRDDLHTEPDCRDQLVDRFEVSNMKDLLRGYVRPPLEEVVLSM